MNHGHCCRRSARARPRLFIFFKIEHSWIEYPPCMTIMLPGAPIHCDDHQASVNSLKSSAPLRASLLSLLVAVMWMHTAAAGVIHSPTQIPDVALSNSSIASFDFPAGEEDSTPTLRADWQLAGMSSSQIAGQGSQVMFAIANSYVTETPDTVSLDIRANRVRLPEEIPISLLKVPIVCGSSSRFI